MEIVFATKNKGKLNEVSLLLPDFKVVSLEDVAPEISVVEDGRTFAENAIKKAEELANIIKRPVMADDSGLEIEFLNGEPGVLSARFLGIDTPYSVKNLEIISMLRGVSGKERAAHFVCVMAFCIPGKKTVTATGTLDGEISTEVRGDGGFGYDPIFYVKSLEKTLGELTNAEKNHISHRAQALEKIKKLILLEDFNYEK